VPSIPKDRAVDTLVRALSPYLGAAMAGAAVRGMCDRMGGPGPSLERERMDAILAALEPGLHVYIGKDRTRQVMERVRTGIDALVGAA
jgi:hypothetical protein